MHKTIKFIKFPFCDIGEINIPSNLSFMDELLEIPHRYHAEYGKVPINLVLSFTDYIKLLGHAWTKQDIMENVIIEKIALGCYELNIIISPLEHAPYVTGPVSIDFYIHASKVEDNKQKQDKDQCQKI